MIKWFKQAYATLSFLGKITFSLLLVVGGLNFYNLIAAYSIGNYGRAIPHGIFVVTLILLTFVVLYSSLQLSRLTKLNNDVKKFFVVNYEEKRISMYEKLLKKKEQEIQ